MRSFSGGVKAFFVTELDEDVEMNTNVALDTLEKILGDDLFRFIDKSTPALTWTFLTNDMIHVMSERLPQLRPWDAVSEGGICTCLPSGDWALREYLEEIPDSLGLKMKFFLKGRHRAKREEFLRILLASPALNTERGLDITSTTIGEQIGVSFKTICAWRKELVDVGALVVIDPSHMIGSKAVTFRAGGPIEEFLSAQYANAMELKDDAKLPETIPDNEWYETLSNLTRYFVDAPEEFLRWVETLPGVNRNQRLRKARSLMKATQIKYSTK